MKGHFYCKECNFEIFPFLDVCGNCGAPIDKRVFKRAKRVPLIVTFIGAFICLSAVIAPVLFSIFAKGSVPNEIGQVIIPTFLLGIIVFLAGKFLA